MNPYERGLLDALVELEMARLEKRRIESQPPAFGSLSAAWAAHFEANAAALGRIVRAEAALWRLAGPTLTGVTPYVEPAESVGEAQKP